MNKINIYSISITFILFIILTGACGKPTAKPETFELITDLTKQDSVFKHLMILTNNTIPQNNWDDSMSFLLLPLQASCPSCRKKTIDSIIKYQNSLADRRFIIISANGGRKTISSFFKEYNKELPIVENKLFLDSTNQAFSYNLYDEQPTIYFTYNRKAYKKIASKPSRIKEDLHQFFSGN